MLATVSDKKLQHSSDNAAIDYYDADVISAHDYYPFGMLMPGRKYSVANTNYRYGFNGKELDKEVAGTTTYDYGFRIYNPGLGRFLSVDPLTNGYPMLTPYQFASDRPIDGLDMDGLEYLPFHSSMYRLGYMTETSVNETGNGKTLVSTSSRTIVDVVYKNIPDKIKDPSTRGYKFVSGGPISDLGRDYTREELANLIYDREKYFVTGTFYGLASEVKSAEPFSNSSTNGARTMRAVGSALGEEGAGVVKNIVDMSTRNDLNKEIDKRKAFYSAINDVNYAITKVAGWREVILNETNRIDLVNFLTDGYLATDITARFTGSQFSQLRLEAYEKQLNIAHLGIQLISQLSAGGEIGLREETKTSIKALLEKYQGEGGQQSFTDLKNLIK